MDVLKFLREGNKVPNPEYNPKTKKGATQPPFFVNTDPDADAKIDFLALLQRVVVIVTLLLIFILMNMLLIMFL